MHDLLNDLLDRDAIRRLLEAYCRGIDRLDSDLVNSVYWPDATDDHGIFIGSGSAFVEFVMPLQREHYDSTLHMLGQSLIELDGLRARSETYFTAYHRKATATAVMLDIVAGRYVDRLEKRQNEWRIQHRSLVLDWNTNVPDMGKPAADPAVFIQPKRDRSDAAYLAHSSRAIAP